MTENSPTIEQLSDSLIDEIVGAVALPKTRFTHWLGWHLFRKITNSFAHIAAPFDQIVGSEGLPKASEFCLSFFCSEVRAEGIDNIPLTGPLLLATNHPGAYDGLTIFSQMPRKDIMWISTEIPLFRLLPNLQEHILFASREDSRNRMVVLRNAIKHLQNGGVLVYFAAGHRDPDPDVYHGATKAIDTWMDVFDMFYKYVDDLQVQPVVVSGVVSKHWAGHWFPNIRRKQIDQQRLAEFGQVISQLLHPKKILFSPSISFGKPYTKVDLQGGDNTTLQKIIALEKSLLLQHVGKFGGDAD